MGAAALLQSPPAVHAPVAEIEIRRSYVGGRPWAPPDVYVAPADMLLATDVLAEIHAAQERRALALLVTIQSAGGSVAAAFALFHALRDFSRSGGIVVVYATGYLASTATMLMLAGDVVVIDSNAALEVHSMYGPNAGELNRSVLEVYAEHTRTPRTELERWLAMTGDDSGKIDPSLALRYGWADRIGGRDEALGWAERLAERLAQGFRYVTERHDVLPPHAPLRGNLWPADGYKPNQATPIARSPVLPSQVSLGTLTDATTTRGAAVHNVWPNASSEDSPPDGADTTTPEWAARVNAGAGAYAGNWVRELSVAANAGFTFLGDKPAGTTAITPGTVLGLRVRASPGDLFIAEAQVRGTSKVSGGASPRSLATIGWFALDGSDNVINTSGSTHNFDFSASTVPTAYQLLSTRLGGTAAPCPAGTTAVWFIFRVVGDGAVGVTGTATAQFDAISIYRVSDAQSDAASAAPALTLAAGGNTFTDIPGTSQTFTPITGSRKIKVSLCFSGFAGGSTASGLFSVRIVFGGTPTQAGSPYNFAYGSLSQHMAWPFIWVLPAAALGPIGTAVNVKAQIRSPTGATASFIMDGNDSVAMVIEEIG